MEHHQILVVLYKLTQARDIARIEEQMAIQRRRKAALALETFLEQVSPQLRAEIDTGRRDNAPGLAYGYSTRRDLEQADPEAIMRWAKKAGPQFLTVKLRWTALKKAIRGGLKVPGVEPMTKTRFFIKLK